MKRKKIRKIKKIDKIYNFNIKFTDLINKKLNNCKK